MTDTKQSPITKEWSMRMAELEKQSASEVDVGGGPSPTVDREALAHAVIAMYLWPDYDADNVPLDIAKRWRDVWKVERLVQERDELRKDAERWQLVRSRALFEPAWYGIMPARWKLGLIVCEGGMPKDLDAAVDAMKEPTR